MSVKAQLSPSILSADFGRLGEQVQEAETAGIGRFQIDVMDGLFVPNISVGLPVVRAMRKHSKAFLESHLMIAQPERYLEEFAEAGSDMIIVHQEACVHLHRAIEKIKSLNLKVGVALNPSTPLCSLEEVVEYLDLILIMTVNPGFGGQKFIASMLPKLERTRAMLQERGLGHVEIEIDGGVDVSTLPAAVKAGATVLVAGSSIYNDKFSPTEGIRRLNEAIDTLNLV